MQQAAIQAVAALDESFFRLRIDRLTLAEKRYLRAMPNSVLGCTARATSPISYTGSLKAVREVGGQRGVATAEQDAVPSLFAAVHCQHALMFCSRVQAHRVVEMARYVKVASALGFFARKQ